MKLRRRIATVVTAAVLAPVMLLATAPSASADADKWRGEWKGGAFQTVKLHARSDGLRVKLDDGYGTYVELNTAPVERFYRPRVDLLFYNLNGRRSRVIHGTQHEGWIIYKRENWVRDEDPTAYFDANPGWICARLAEDGVVRRNLTTCAELKP